VGLAEQEYEKIIEKVRTMDEIAASYKTPMTKRQSIQWIMKRMAPSRPKPRPLGQSRWWWHSLISRG
jgi:hypothetical protein